LKGTKAILTLYGIHSDLADLVRMLMPDPCSDESICFNGLIAVDPLDPSPPSAYKLTTNNEYLVDFCLGLKRRPERAKRFSNLISEVCDKSSLQAIESELITYWEERSKKEGMVKVFLE